jgi:two-component system chemotaxis response regulator CheY
MCKILIVDDSPIIRDTISPILKEAGHQVIGEADNGQEAIDIFHKTKPDLVLLDILLPGESGLDILKKLKSIDSRIKVLVVTAVNQDAVSGEAKNLGAMGVLYKPFDADELVSAIKEALE